MPKATKNAPAQAKPETPAAAPQQAPSAITIQQAWETLMANPQEALEALGLTAHQAWEQLTGIPKYDVRVKVPSSPAGALRAFATFNVCGDFAVRCVEVREGAKGLFVAMPDRRINGEYKDICFPCTKEARMELNSAILDAYQQALTQAQAKGDQPREAPMPQQSQNQPIMGGM